MTNEQAWEMIQKMGWGIISTDYSTIAKVWFQTVGKEKMEQLYHFVIERQADLYRAVQEFEKTHDNLDIGSDDGFSDVTAHIVGLGREEFNSCLKYPKQIETRYKAKYGSSEGYKESFLYCFQEPTPERTQEQKDKTVKDLLDTVKEVKDMVSALHENMDTLWDKYQRMERLARVVEEDRKNLS